MEIIGMSGSGTEGAQNGPEPRLVRAAHEFEGLMLKELLKPMTSEEEGEDAGAASGSGSALSEYGCEALGQGLSQRGGFGIAEQIIARLSHSRTPGETTAVTGK